MSTAQTESTVQLAIKQLGFSRQFLLGLIESFSEEHMTLRVADAGNHALWIMGHVAFADDTIVAAFAGDSKLPPGHAELFSAGTLPHDDASVYPSRAELLERMSGTRQRTIEWAQTLTGEAASQPAPAAIQAIAPDAITAAFTLAHHDFLHAGQLTTIRASLGMKPLMM